MAQRVVPAAHATLWDSAAERVHNLCLTMAPCVPPVEGGVSGGLPLSADFGGEALSPTDLDVGFHIRSSISGSIDACELAAPGSVAASRRDSG